MADTRETIKWLKAIKEKYIHGGDDDFDEKRRQAIDHAVAVLEGREIDKLEPAQRWIPVTERLPKEHEYMAETQRGEQYYVRLLIAYMTDTVEYEIGYYDGWKWMTEMPIHIIKNVVAWKPFEPLPEPPKGE